jgi:hypothetical protein
MVATDDGYRPCDCNAHRWGLTANPQDFGTLGTSRNASPLTSRVSAGYGARVRLGGPLGLAAELGVSWLSRREFTWTDEVGPLGGSGEGGNTPPPPAQGCSAGTSVCSDRPSVQGRDLNLHSSHLGHGDEQSRLTGHQMLTFIP